MDVLKSEEKMMENVQGGDLFSNDGSARTSMLLKTESTTDILIGQFYKVQNSCFKEHL